MPNLTEEKIKAKIADGSIFAMSVDTEIFERYQLNLNSPVLKKLGQFANGLIQVLLSEIVVNEVKNHIALAAKESQSNLKKAIKEQGKRWSRTLDLAALPDELALSNDPREAAESYVTDYLAAIGAEVVPASGKFDVSGELLRRYFSKEPPFENNDRKKHEFPDGFALLSLEIVAKPRRGLVLCVSRDEGWKRFAKHSDFLVCESELDLVLSYFNDSGRTTADQTMSRWKGGAASELVQEVDRAFEYQLGDTDFYPTGSAPLFFESRPIGAAVQWVDLESASNPVVIDTNDETVTFTVNIEAVVEFEANFRFYVRDSIDKGPFLLSAENFLTKDRVEFQLAITVSRDLDPEPEVVDVEIFKKHIKVDFGEVEPFSGLEGD